MQIRHLFTDAQLETRDDSEPTIEGYFSVFGPEYHITDDISEVVEPTAFHLDRDTDVRALVNHDTTLVLGRTKAGTLTLAVDERGLHGVVKVNPADPQAMGCYERVKRGDVSQCSFGFNVLSRTVERREDGRALFRLNDVQLFEVSVCTFPAYEDTEISAREKDFRAVLDREAAEWRQRMRLKLEGEKHA